MINTDSLIIGAGPVGLFQVFELGLLEIKSHIIDTLPKIGGQCIELYPDKPIYDIPALPVCTGKELIDNLKKQISPFNPIYHLNEEAISIKKNENSFIVTTSKKKFNTKTIFIAGGVGAFQPRKLKLDGIDKYENIQLHYNIKDISIFKEKNIVICGGGDSALDWVLKLINISNSVTLLHRRNEFRGTPSSVEKIKKLCKNYEMQLLISQIIGFEENNEKLSILKVIGNDSVVRKISLDHLLVFFGLSPKLGPILNWGLKIIKKQIEVNTENFETNIPGIFAVGDINIYPGKKKLILSGFHEAALAAFGSVKYIKPKNQKINMQYTTTSTKIQKILGVKTKNLI